MFNLNIGEGLGGSPSLMLGGGFAALVGIVLTDLFRLNIKVTIGPDLNFTRRIN